MEKNEEGYSFYDLSFIERFIAQAITLDYRTDRINEWSIVFKKECEEHGNVTYNLYWNKKTLALPKDKQLFTVQTTLDHPKRERRQLNRKGLKFDQCVELLKNPRKHTGKGYY